MDSTALIVGVLVGGGLAGVFAFLQIRVARDREAGLTAELAAALTRAQVAEVEQAKLAERCVRVDELEASIAAKEQTLDGYRSELQELRLKEQKHEEQLNNERGRLQLREELLQKQVAEKVEFLEQKESQLKEAFDTLANEALRKSRQDFLALAEEKFKAQSDQARTELETRQKAIDTLVKPISDTLKEYQENLARIEVERATQTSKLSEQIEQVNKLQQAQSSATSNLRGLLRGPTTRGRIGEMFLKTLLDSAGLTENIHYRLQVSSSGDERISRPDCIIYLPSGKCLVIDAKTPLNAYEDSYNTDDELLRAAKLKDHARNMRGEIDRLSRRDYEKVELDVEHVIMYLPIEASLSAAYEVDPDIHTYGWNKSVVLASPTLLYLFLHMVRHDWRQHEVAKNAREIEKLGGEMVDRIRVVAEHVSKVGTSLDSATKNYNRAVTSMDTQLFTTAAKFTKLGAKAKKDPLPVPPVETTATSFDKPILKTLPPAARVEELEATSLFMIDDEPVEPSED